MKKHLTLLCIALCSMYGAAHAQIEKGTVLIGGEISGSSSTTDFSNNFLPQKATSLFIDPSIGVAVKQNGVLGIALGLSYSNLKGYSSGPQYGDLKSNGYSPSIFYRRYINLAKNFYFFTEADAGFVYSKLKNVDTLGKIISIYTTTGGQLSLAPGIAYKICKNLHIEILIPSFVNVQYEVIKTTALNSVNSKEKSFGVSTSLSGSNISFLGVGFKYFIPVKHHA